ncbi:MAG: hypothetical protein WAN34_02525 [Acidimicrobiia bacterium]
MQIAADLCEALSDLEAAPEHIDSSPTQSCRLAPSQRPISEDVDESLVLILHMPSQLVDLGRREEQLFTTQLAR